MRQIVSRCPITGKRHTASEPPDGAPVVVEVDDLDLPVGWGELVLRRVLVNPDYAEVTDARAQRIGMVLAQIDAASAGESAELVAMAKDQARAQIEREFPLPPEEITVEYTFSSLSPEGFEALTEALAPLGMALAPLTEPDAAGPAAQPEA